MQDKFDAIKSWTDIFLPDRSFGRKIQVIFGKVINIFFLTWGPFYPLKIALQKSFFTPYFRGKPLVQKSANLMPSGTILKTVQKSPIYIFVNK